MRGGPCLGPGLDSGSFVVKQGYRPIEKGGTLRGSGRGVGGRGTVVDNEVSKPYSWNGGGVQGTSKDDPG